MGNKTKLLPYLLTKRQNLSSPLTNSMLVVTQRPNKGIKALLQAPSGKEGKWQGHYIDDLPEDPWGNPYQYRFPGTKNINKSSGYDIWSLGQDGVESADDIGNWN